MIIARGLIEKIRFPLLLEKLSIERCKIKSDLLIKKMFTDPACLHKI